MEITMREWAFIAEYLKDFRPAAAMRRAEPHLRWPAQDAYKILHNPMVVDEINRCKTQLIEKAKLEVYDVIVDIKKVLSSDGRELIQYCRGACRYCHGDAHLYQRRPSEDEEAMRLGNYDPMGGVGYDSRKEPHPECPECDGEGIMRTVAMDTRYLSPEGVAMYDGVKPTRNGIEIKMRSRDAARAAAAQYLGMNKLDLTLKDGRKATELSDDELAALATQAMPK